MYSKYETQDEINPNTCLKHVRHKANIYITWGIINHDIDRPSFS